MKVTILFPIKYNNGEKVCKTFINELFNWRKFSSGITEDNLTKGYWIDNNGIEHEDICRKVTIVSSRDRLFLLLKEIEYIKQKMGQKCMYVEISGYDGVQFL